MKKQLTLSAAGRKLSLSKRTISNLKLSEMSNKIGGSTDDYTHHRCHGQTYHCSNNCTKNQTCIQVVYRVTLAEILLPIN